MESSLFYFISWFLVYERFIKKISNSFWECDYLVTKDTHPINSEAYFLVVYNKRDLMIYLKILFLTALKNSLFSIFFVITKRQFKRWMMKSKISNMVALCKLASWSTFLVLDYYVIYFVLLQILIYTTVGTEILQWISKKNY